MDRAGVALEHFLPGVDEVLVNVVELIGPFVYVLTANHVTDRTDRVEVAVFTAESHPRPANVYRSCEVVARSVEGDLALVILGNLEGYWENAAGLVKSLLEKADKGKKKDLYAAAMNLGIETVARGRSPAKYAERAAA